MSALIFFGIATLVLIVGVLIFVPRWQVQGGITSSDSVSRNDDFETQKEKLALEDELRKTLAQIIGGLLVFVGLAITYNTYLIGAAKQDLDRESQVTDRFSKAITHLGDDKLAVRVGGLFELERIASDSIRDRETVKQVLYTYLHTNFRVKADSQDVSQSEPRENSNGLLVFHSVADSEVQTILNIVQRLMNQDERLDLRNLDLAGRNFARANYKIANFSSANLAGTVLIGSNFQSARFTRANLDRATTDFKEWERFGDSMVKLVTPESLKPQFRGADFSETSAREADFAESNFSNAHFNRANVSGTSFRDCIMNHARFVSVIAKKTIFIRAHLSGTSFYRTDLSGANFADAKLDLTDFSGANLSDVANLTIEQFRSAIIDDKTILPQTLAAYREELLKSSAVNAERRGNIGEIEMRKTIVDPTP